MRRGDFDPVGSALMGGSGVVAGSLMGEMAGITTYRSRTGEPPRHCSMRHVLFAAALLAVTPAAAQKDPNYDGGAPARFDPEAADPCNRSMDAWLDCAERRKCRRGAETAHP
jgi:hypothetical protein